MFERSRNETSRLDEKWYREFEKIGAFDVYSLLTDEKGPRDTERKRFLEGAVVNPALNYPKIDAAELKKNESELLELKKRIITEEPNEVVMQLYRWKINEKLAELRLLLSIAEKKWRKVQLYSEFIYGAPDESIFQFTLARKMNEWKSDSASENENIRQAAAELIALFPDFTPSFKFSEPSAETFALAKDKTMTELGPLINIPEEEIKEKLSSDKIRELFSAALSQLGKDGEWKIITDPTSATGISVSQKEKEVRVPATREAIFKKVQKLILHELGTHVKRRINGEQSKLMLLGLGLDRYEKGEEGVATMREQVLEKSFKEFSGAIYYFAIGLAYGLDGQPKRDFRELFEIFKKVYLLEKLKEKKQPTPAEAEELAAAKAYDICVRVFRGTGCKQKGVCFTKDLAYREGNIGAWEVASKSPVEMQRFSVGKYDPGNPRHIWILEQLEITDEDLKKL